MRQRLDITNLNDLSRFAKELSNQINVPCLILLEGEMGSGKTTFVSYLVSALGGRSEDVSSPTFSLHHSYEIKNGGSVEHFDLFRIEGEADLSSLALEEFFQTNVAIVIIEWPERAQVTSFPISWPQLTLRFKLDSLTGKRTLEVSRG